MKRLIPVLCLLALLAGQAWSAEPALWLRYPAISPDGQTLVFTYQDDLYIVPVQGGVATPLTRHPAYDYMPVWSPDGKTIAFASDRYGNFDVFTIPVAGGRPRRLTYHSTAQYPSSFTPDGKEVLFSATLEDDAKNVQFPSGVLSELYAVPAEGGRIRRLLSTPAEEAKFDPSGQRIVYQDRKGFENAWRKHHTSSVTRDIWIYDSKTGKHQKMSPFAGEDRSPSFSHDGKTLYYLSEQFGSFNVVSAPVDRPDQVAPVTTHQKHPVRFLSLADDNTLCYSYHGELYVRPPGGRSKKIRVEVMEDAKSNPEKLMKLTQGANDCAVSPDGEEVAFIVRGEVFVTSVAYGTTKRITHTPEQERSVSFSPDGQAILYASERNGSWNLYQTQKVNADEPDFTHATLLKEEALLEIPEETFQPAYSPDGKEVAYLYERTTLKVLNLESQKSRTVLPPEYNYSYTDGDQWFEWSPDSKWLLVNFMSPGRWSYEVGLIAADGKQPLINLTQSGYWDNAPRWMMGGKMFIWFSDRHGLWSHGGGGGTENDVFGMFFTQEAYDRFRLNEEEYQLLQEQEKKAKEKAKKDEKKDGKEKKEEKAEEKETSLVMELDQIQDRKLRLTRHSCRMADAVLTQEGDKLYYLAAFEQGYDLWEQDIRKQTTSLFLKLKSRGGSLKLSKDGKHLFVFAGGNITRITLAGKKQKRISFKAEFNLNQAQERAYMFEHAWRQIKKKFYDPNLHGVDWDFYRKAYRPFLPHINNNYAFAEMLSEMLGELNGSHTGSGYRARFPDGDQTARLGVFYDWSFEGDGLKIAEIIDKSPLMKAKTQIEPGVIIEAVDGEKIEKDQSPYRLFNRKAGKAMLLSLYHPETQARWQERVKPISAGQENELLYQRWVKGREKETERLSKGRLGYVHVRSMVSSSYRSIFEDIFGKYTNKEALIVDTRFNGGGNLVEQLTTLLSGKKYLTNIPRGQEVGIRPDNRWTKPSIVIIGESNYSDAHGFPYGYKALGIGELVGMPVPGTMTSVWWETLQDPTLYFGMPQVGKYDLEGKYLENQQLEPDYRVKNEYEKVIQGRDQQLEKAVEVLLKQLDQEP